MAAYNSSQFMGNLGEPPTLRQTKANKPVASMRIASNRKWRDDGGQDHEETTWMSVTVWGAQAENCAKYLKKGSGVFVEGRLVNTDWTDNDGVKRYGVEIHARTVQFLGSGGGGGGPRAPHPADRDNSGGGGPHDLPPPPEEEPSGGF